MEFKNFTRNKLIYLVCIFCFISLINCNGQNKLRERRIINDNSKLVGDGCDGCELMYVGIPTHIKSTDTSPGWNDQGQKLLITGTVYKLGGKIPASDVIIYYWQTDTKGHYSSINSNNEQITKHGRIRGWVKTDKDGKYSIYTIRPAPYPDSNIPAHIHLSIKEPLIKTEYYIDDLVFDDDKLLTSYKRKNLKNRGGSGILRLFVDHNYMVAEHNIILGLNIPNYPEKTDYKISSGLKIGEDNPSFTPYHAYGPDKGTKTCPVCKYGRFQGILYFVGNHPDWNTIKDWLLFLEQQSELRKEFLKVYFIYGNENNYNKDLRQIKLESIGDELKLKHVALTFVSSFSDKESDIFLNKINAEVDNTFIIYSNRTIVDKYINLEPSQENYKLIKQTLDNTKSKYDYLPETKHH